MNGHVLLAEDNVAYRHILTDELTHAGLRVTTFSNGRELLNAVFGSVAPPFVILTSLTMPVASGVVVIDELRRASLLDLIPVLVITAREAADPDVPCVEKPLQLDALFQRLETLTASASWRAGAARIRLERARQHRRRPFR